MSLANGIAVRLRSDNQRGLFVLRPVHRDEILITYDGPILDHPTRYSVQIDERLHIDGTPESNAYLNHSCMPNTYVDWRGVCLRALRDIAAGDELTCNYLTPTGRFTRSSYAPAVRRIATERSGALSICRRSNSENWSGSCRSS